MKDAKLFAKKRTLGGSSHVRRMRKTGVLPAVIYGDEKEPVSIQLDTHAFEQLLHHHTSETLLIEIDLEGEGTMSVLVKEVQHHPVSSDLLHVDLQRVAANKPIHVEIPLELVGEAAGVKLGGTLEHIMHAIHVECLPGDLVESIKVDVTQLGIGDSLHVCDLKLPKMKILADADAIMAVVAGPRAEQEEESAAAVAEPEVIAKKKGEDE